MCCARRRFTACFQFSLPGRSANVCALRCGVLCPSPIGGSSTVSMVTLARFFLEAEVDGEDVIFFCSEAASSRDLWTSGCHLGRQPIFLHLGLGPTLDTLDMVTTMAHLVQMCCSFLMTRSACLKAAVCMFCCADCIRRRVCRGRLIGILCVAWP